MQRPYLLTYPLFPLLTGHKIRYTFIQTRLKSLRSLWNSREYVLNLSVVWGDTMQINISEEIKNQTKECPSDFHCLADNEGPMCDVDLPMCSSEYIFEGNGLFIKPLSDHECTYQMPFRSGFLCHCPTRREIFKKYNI